MSRIPKTNNDYLKYLELCISGLERIEKDEILKRPTVAKVIASSIDFLNDYREEIKDSRRRKGE